jgi:MraZ protein
MTISQADSGAIAETSYQFSGHYRHAIDAKGRVSIPARLRQQVKERAELLGRLEAYYLLKGPDGALLLLPEDSWEKLNQALFSNAPNDPPTRYLRRETQAMAFPVTPDKQGRIAIPPPLAAAGDLSKEALFLGYGPYVEIWDPGRYGHYLREKEGTYSREEMWQQMYGVLVTQLVERVAAAREVDSACTGNGGGSHDPADSTEDRALD